MKSIFTRPVFINPLAYLVIPELMLINRSTPYDFSSNQYVFQVITTGLIKGKLLLAGNEYILHLDLYSKDGNVVLGEFYLDGNSIGSTDNFILELSNGFVTITFGGGNISYPGLIAAWSAKGKSNDDEDRAILKDLTSNGYDITLNGFAFNTKGSGYNNPNYPDALVFDGVDDYGINENMPIQDDFTLIVNREYINTNRGSCLISKANVVGQGAFVMEIAASNLNTGHVISSFNSVTDCRLYNNDNISYLTPNRYNNINISRGTANDTSVITLGTIRVNDAMRRNFNGAFYSAYLFDRSLDEQEIKAFIRKYIDPEYVLPSEQTTT